MMHHQCEFSHVTKKYLTRFYEILDEMVCGMTDAKLEDSISHNFIVQMVPDHKAAIDMSYNILQYTTFVPLQNIASTIITEQMHSIENMMCALDRCSALCSSEQDLCLYQRRFDQIAETMFCEMRTACVTNDINANFMREMIPHHRGALRMCENALRFSICPELDPIIQAILVSQRAGIREMERLLRCLGACA